jgi:hypothetical protein
LAALSNIAGECSFLVLGPEEEEEEEFHLLLLLD